jgi:hypothetical protein
LKCIDILDDLGDASQDSHVSYPPIADYALRSDCHSAALVLTDYVCTVWELPDDGICLGGARAPAALRVFQGHGLGSG